MRRLDLSLQELGAAKLLVYNGDVNDLDNNINHKNILSFQRTTFVDVPICYFDLTELVPLSEIQKYTLDKYDLLNVLKVSTSVISHAIKQNRDLKSILFSPEYVYLDGNFNPYFLPLRANEEGNNYKYFLKNVIVDSIITPSNNDNYIQLLLNCLNDPGFSVDYLIKMVEQLLNNNPVDFINTSRPIRNSPSVPIGQGPTTQEVQRPIPTPSTPEIYPSNLFPNAYRKDSTQSTRYSQQINQQQLTSFLEEQQANQQSSSQFPPKGADQAQGPTTPNRQTQVYLISEEDQSQKIIIDTGIFAIGRNPEIVNYSINSPYVGRLHAVIKNDNGRYFITDKNSTNGTYLNGQRLQPEFPQSLKSGDLIKFAKHTFLFSIS